MKRILIAAGAGAGLLFSLEPFGFTVAGVVFVLCLILLSESLAEASWRAVLLWYVITSLFITLFAFHWITFALTQIAHMYWISSILIAAVYGILTNLKVLLVLAAGRLNVRIHRLVLYPAVFVFGDLVSWQIFPWYTGNAYGNLSLAQSARFAGTAGLGALVVLQAMLVLEGYRIVRKTSNERRAWLAGAAVLIAAYAYGFVAIAWPGEPQNFVRAAYIQPATGPGLNRFKDDDEFAAQALGTVYNLGLRALLDAGQADLLVLPESSIPFLGTNDSEENKKHGIYSSTFHGIVVSLARIGYADVLYNELDLESGKLRNRASLFGHEGRVRGAYNKQHLVPFGEYLPLEDFAGGVFSLRRFFPEASRYTAADKPALLPYRKPRSRPPLVLPGDTAELSHPEKLLGRWPHAAGEDSGNLAALICYEGLFPGLVRGFFKEGEVDFFVNLANDSWFGDGLENYQHSGAVRLRAIESGRSVLRVTLTGVSTAFDRTGRNLVSESRPGETAVGSADLPVYRGHTIYSLAGDWPLAAALFALFLYCLWPYRLMLSSYLRRRT